MKIIKDTLIVISFLISIILAREKEPELESEEPIIPYKSINQCTNIWSSKTLDCYLLDPSSSKNICALYHVSLLKKESGSHHLEDYSKCHEIVYEKKSIEEILIKEKKLYDSEDSEIEILSFGVAASGHNLCSEYSYQDLNRTENKTKNYCKQSKVSFKSNKCCYIHINATMWENSTDNRCMEVENEKKAEELVHYIKGKIESQGAFGVYTDIECYNVEESIYGKENRGSKGFSIKAKNGMNAIIIFLLFITLG